MVVLAIIMTKLAVTIMGKPVPNILDNDWLSVSSPSLWMKIEVAEPPLVRKFARLHECRRCHHLIVLVTVLAVGLVIGQASMIIRKTSGGAVSGDGINFFNVRIIIADHLVHIIGIVHGFHQAFRRRAPVFDRC
jgi:hypothetical protein